MKYETKKAKNKLRFLKFLTEWGEIYYSNQCVEDRLEDLNDLYDKYKIKKERN